MKKRIIKIIYLCITLSALLAIMFSIYKIYRITKEYKDINTTYASIQDNYTELSTDNELNVDWEKLIQRNKDVVAWIKINKTRINYPVVIGKDNYEYLNKDFNGNYSKAGCIFESYDNNKEFKDNNTIIYGHNLNNGAMFGDIRKYENKNYLNKHNEITIYLPNGEKKEYIIFAFEKTKVDNKEIFNTKVKDLSKYIEIINKYSKNKKNISNSILTLSTCTNDNKKDRYVLHAYLK